MNFDEVFLSTAESKYKVHILHKAGKLKKLVAKLYTTNLTDSVDKIVDRNLWKILELLYPNTLISDRTALELKPIQGYLFIISEKTRQTTIGNITIKPRKGWPPIDSDTPFMKNLFLTSNERAVLENARPTRTSKGEISRTFSDIELEEYLDRTITKYGEYYINKMRDRMKVISKKIGLGKEFEKVIHIAL
ncbi:MAG: hypothetical protein LBG04_03000 [Holosporaceae bacterium]|jgi:hypothetical protein|nr:hypothetical protein [Holosporaceae bacterium]